MPETATYAVNGLRNNECSLLQRPARKRTVLLIANCGCERITGGLKSYCKVKDRMIGALRNRPCQERQVSRHWLYLWLRRRGAFHRQACLDLRPIVLYVEW